MAVAEEEVVVVEGEADAVVAAEVAAEEDVEVSNFAAM